MASANAYPPITLITGPRESGRTTYAVLVTSGLFRQGVPCFHNSTALFGWNIEDYLNEEDGLLTLARKMPSEPTTLIIEEADTLPATSHQDHPNDDAVVQSALDILAAKRCYLILTVVQGNERGISKHFVENAYEHVTPNIMAKSVDDVSLATLHRLGKHLIPVGSQTHDPELVIPAMMLADTFKDMRKGATDGFPVRFTEDNFVETRQTPVDQMEFPRHPEHPLFYRQRIVREIDPTRVHRLTQEHYLDFTWLESVNEHRNETIALQLLERTFPQWGFDYQPIPTPQNDRFPDGKAEINGQMSNLEVVSIQPNYPSGHNLHTLVGLTQFGRTPQLEEDPILYCQDCRPKELRIPGANLQALPVHNDNHRWVLYLPASRSDAGFPGDLTVTPLLDIDQEGFSREFQGAVKTKSGIFAVQGLGQRNWVVVFAQGFPIDPDWYSALPRDWPENVDRIVVVATQLYAGALYLNQTYHDYTVIVLKCPEDARGHNPYHPGYEYRLSHFDQDFQPLSPETHSIEEVTYVARRNGGLPNPMKRTIKLSDEYGNELESFQDVVITASQTNEVLAEERFEWYEQAPYCLTLRTLGNVCRSRFWALAQKNDHNVWIATVYQEADRTKMEFSNLEDAKSWCECELASIILISAQQ